MYKGSDLEQFIEDYNNEEDFIEQLGMIYDFVDRQPTNPIRYDTIKQLIIHFNDIGNHLSELKTMLVISKGVKVVESERADLLDTYCKKKELLKYNL